MLGDDVINKIIINLIEVFYKGTAIIIILNIKLLKPFIIIFIIIGLLKVCCKTIINIIKNYINNLNSS